MIISDKVHARNEFEKFTGGFADARHTVGKMPALVLGIEPLVCALLFVWFPDVSNSQKLSMITKERMFISEEFSQRVAALQQSPLVIYQCENRPSTPCESVPSMEMADLANLTTLLNKQYASRHNYDYLRVTASFADRHPAWCKIALTHALLQYYSYTMYLDSDAVVHTKESLEKALQYKKYLRNRIFLNERSRFGDIPNTGILFFRNSTLALDYLQSVWYWPQRFPEALWVADSLNVTYYRWPWELASYVLALKDIPDFQKLIYLTPRYTLDHPHGTIIRHFWSKHKPGMNQRYRPVEYLDYMKRRYRAFSSETMHELVCSVQKRSITWP